ncbi:MAG: hypothetical protein IT350_10415 [Deltaproteobacteria bacterium]|nr:hypothetical protein [Deltaproteobacteria bacterium]
MSTPHARIFRRVFGLVILAACCASLVACTCDGDDDDATDDDDDGGGGPGGFAGDDDAACDRVLAVGDGIAERVDGAWIDRTPDLFQSSWRLFDAANPSCDEILYVGRDDAEARGVILRAVKGAFAKDNVPVISSSFDIAAVDSRSGLTLAAGGDWASRSGFILRETDGDWEREALPAVSTDWWLTDLVVLGTDRGAALGFDRIADRSFLLRLDGDAWSVEPIALDGIRLHAFDLADADNGLAVGADASGTSGAIAWLSDGKWYSATPPEVSVDWMLSDVAYTGDATAVFAGRSYDVGVGVLLDWLDGSIASSALPTVTSSWDLRTACSLGEAKSEFDADALVAGSDRESGGGVVLRRAGGAWSLDGLLPFAPNALVAF